MTDKINRQILAICSMCVGIFITIVYFEIVMPQSNFAVKIVDGIFDIIIGVIVCLRIEAVIFYMDNWVHFRQLKRRMNRIAI